jgi:membrane associated rhomboid family serine protease
MPIYRRYLSYIKFPLPGADFMTAFTVLAILVQFWLGSMVDESGFVTAELEHNYLVLGLSWIGISQWHLWQIVTYALAHGGWFHLVANLLMLWVVGGRVIDILGQKKFVLIVMVGVFVGGLLHLVIDYVVMGRGYPGTQLVGISGGCLALLLTLTTLSPASRVWPFRVSRKNLGIGILLAMLLLLLMTPALNFLTYGKNHLRKRWFRAICYQPCMPLWWCHGWVVISEQIASAASISPRTSACTLSMGEENINR